MATKKTNGSLTVHFSLWKEKETKGAYRYQETDEKGKEIEQVFAKVGSLYIRKTAYGQGVQPPERLKATLEAV
jgi:hypothetical protein